LRSIPTFVVDKHEKIALVIYRTESKGCLQSKNVINISPVTMSS